VRTTRAAQALGHLAIRAGAEVRFHKTSLILADLAGGHADTTRLHRECNEAPHGALPHNGLSPAIRRISPLTAGLVDGRPGALRTAVYSRATRRRWGSRD